MTISRIKNFGAISSELALLSDMRLAALLANSELVETSTGGRTTTLKIAGSDVFVKKVRLTDLDRRPENMTSTANLFNLPTFLQYGLSGIASPGFGVWRELAAHVLTTNWVLTSECSNFPLMYHWRILPKGKPPSPTVEQLKEVERDTKYWNNAAGVRNRLIENLSASAEIVLFLEYFPENVHQWLRKQIAIGGTQADSACLLVEKSLIATSDFMKSHGFLHFDAHFHNILTDGRELFFADYGLALSKKYDLAQAEKDFYQAHENYDLCYTMAHLVKWILIELFGADNYQATLRECAQGKLPEKLSPVISKIVSRHLPVAVIMNKFFTQIINESKTTPYPTVALNYALHALNAE